VINRSNWHLMKRFLKYRVSVLGVTGGTANLDRVHLEHLITWLDESEFRTAYEIEPSFLVYLRNLERNDQKLTNHYLRKIAATVRRFCDWFLLVESGGKRLRLWRDSLRIRKESSDYLDRDIVTYQHMIEILAAPAETLPEQRAKAAACFLFLSGARVTAFVTLPTVAIDLSKQTVKQWTKLGVRTKNKKSATTHLLDLPYLLVEVQWWDDLVRSRGASMWFAHLEPGTGEIDSHVQHPGKYRDVRLRTDFRRWCKRVGLKYYSPHKFRHGHVIHAVKLAADYADLKAISQNVMHESTRTTDEIYGRLSERDVGDRIAGLGVGKNRDFDLLRELERLLKDLKG